MTDLAPLDDPSYVPAHPPVGGEVPAVVERWGARSQVRWFDRFREQLRPRPMVEWERWYCSTVAHRGPCCTSCVEDAATGHGIDECCCKALRE